MNDRCEMYRHFSKADELLYVGISLSTVSRLRQHRCKSRWFNDITRIEIERFNSREAAERAEQRAIKTERPKFNQRHSERSSAPKAKAIAIFDTGTAEDDFDYSDGREFSPDLIQRGGISTLWHHPAYPMSYVLRRAEDTMGWRVSRNMLVRMFGNRHKR